MKASIDITLTTLQVGSCRRVVTLGINGKNYALDFLRKLQKDDYNKWRSLYARITTVADYDSYENQITFRHVGSGIFEFKRDSLRLYGFYHSPDDTEDLILCTNGGRKNTKKQQNTDIKRAQSIQAQYLKAYSQAHVKITIEEAE